MSRGLVTVTGATGFLGRYLVPALAADGWRIRVLARRDVIHPLWRGLEVEVVPGDLGDDRALDRACAGADVVIHGAGLIKARSRAAFFIVNEQGARRVAERAEGEGIYSMVGDVAPLREIAAVKREMGAYLLVDEAHSMGVLGATGRGLAEEVAAEADVDVIVGTFSKSLGSVGGFCVSDMADFDVMRIVCRPYMFTASLPPAVIASTLGALRRVQEAPDLRHKLHANAQHLYDGLTALGLATGPTCSPIVAVTMPDQAMAAAMWNLLLQNGVYLNLALPPATPDNRPLLRSSVSAAHSIEQLDQVIAVMGRVARELGVLEGPPKRALG